MRHTTLLAVVALGLFFCQASALVNLGRLVPYTFEWQPPVTRWLLPSDPTVIPPSDVLAWRKIGSKLWTFMNKLDHDFVNAAGATTPPALAVQRIFGPSVTCGRFTRQFIRMPFHDCGTFDVGNTGSVGDTGRPRFGCNASLRLEVAPCDAVGPQCVNGVEAAVDLATGAFLPETAFASVEAKYGAANIVWGQDTQNQRRENTGFANMLAFLYQVKMETLVDEPPATRLAQVSLADIMMYAGMLAVAKCGGPHIEFYPGRTDSAVFDAAERLPAPTEPLHHTISYFWTNGLTDFDAVNLLAAHTTACFNVGCLDATPTRYDINWAQQISTVTTATDPRICNFAPADAGLPPPAPVQLCFLPADAELNARADFQQYLSALKGTTPIPIAANQQNPCDYQPGVPVIPGEFCDVGVGVGYDFTPFSPLSIPGPQGGPVNLCERTSIPLQERSACPRGAANAAFRRAVATSYFKMTMLYADAVTGAVAGARYGVQRQPCTPGLIQIGTVNIVVPPNPVCPCCPNPLPQFFNIGLEDPPVQAPLRGSVHD